MDLNDQERYAAAALFTLALHHSQGRVNGGIPGSKHNLGAWGKPADEEFLHSLDSASEHATLNHAELNRFWGYDCYAAGGLCDILYGHLHIPETSKPGLKLLADVMDPSSQADIIKQYRDLLDASLASEPGPEVEPLPNYKEVNEEGIWEPPLDAPPLEGEQPTSPNRPGSGARKAGQGIGGGHASRSKPAREDQDEEPLLGSSGDAEESEEQAAAAEAAARPIAQQHEDTLNQQGLEREFEDKATVSGNDHASASQLAGAAAQAGPSAVAMGALMEILDATMLRHAMPNLQDVLEQRAAGAKEGASPATSSGKQPSPKEAAEQAIDQPELAVLRLPQVRWYDARARVALRMMAEWMRVPWAKMIIFESLLAEQAQLPEARQEGPEAEKSWKSKRIKYAKIGAAASGAAALMVITGGLAAPLLAGFAGAAFAGVGLGSVGALVGGSAGTAAMIAGITGGGGYLAGSKMAHRVGDVQQFGFRQVPDDGIYTSGMGKAVDEAVPDQSLDAMAAKADAQDVPLEQQAQAGNAESPSTLQSDAASGTPSSPHPRASGSSPAAAAEEPQEGLAKQKSWFSWGSGKKKQPAEDEENPLLPVPGALAKQANPHMSLIIGVNGWVAKPEDFVDMWRHLGCAEHERFTLVWETEELIRLNTSLVDFVKSQAAQAAAKWFAASVSAALMAAVALPLTILSATNFIDGAWGIALDRAGKAGILLAHVLMSGAHGDRPVTLIGYSMGARLVFSCLMELSRCQAKGIVEHAILLGTPENVVPERFAAARRVVAGRLVNGYSKQDWILGVLFRSGSGFTRAAAGLTPVGVPNIENVDLSDLVTGHFDYIKKMDTIIDQLGFA